MSRPQSGLASTPLPPCCLQPLPSSRRMAIPDLGSFQGWRQAHQRVRAVGTERHPGGAAGGCPHLPPLAITFCSASRSGLPRVNAKTGSLATFGGDDVCFHHSLGSKGREQRQTGQWWPPPDPAPLSPVGKGDVLGWPRILKSRANIELGGKN